MLNGQGPKPVTGTGGSATTEFPVPLKFNNNTALSR